MKEEKKVLSAEEIEAQTLLELPDWNLMQVNTSLINAAIQAITIALGL
jgi:hypothetical protein